MLLHCTPADQIFEVAILYPKGFKRLLAIAAMLVYNLVSFFDPSFNPQIVVVRYRDSLTTFYREGSYTGPMSASYAVQMLNEELQTKTVEEFCKDRSLDIPNELP